MVQDAHLIANQLVWSPIAAAYVHVTVSLQKQKLQTCWRACLAVEASRVGSAHASIQWLTAWWHNQGLEALKGPWLAAAKSDCPVTIKLYAAVVCRFSSSSMLLRIDVSLGTKK